ncbi:hypothetical protein Pcinc_007169 [Petrolisthes cinctipes]|uniref:Serine racemase n=1 Tax=Petrolisthes cinctipes TaxID=88211 RepID=A0AAE1GBF1_PETCI|nr:hypothetical protein Pcinc_007169 [Petrolisthes cinctipes]
MNDQNETRGDAEVTPEHNNTSPHVITLDDIHTAARRICGWVHKTPVLTSKALDAMAGRHLYFKAENLQKTGSFKVRGACNAVFLEKEKNPGSAGVVTHSSGNHAQAVAYAASCVGLGCSVVVPRGTPKVKCDAIQDYGGQLVFCDPTPMARKETCAALARDTGRTTIPSSDNTDVICGQGTLALELLEEVPDLDAVVLSVGGGGMLAGVATTIHHLHPHCQVYGVEPEGKELECCLRARVRLWSESSSFLNTVADSIRLRAVGPVAFPFICDYANRHVFTVTDDQMIQGTRLSFERLKQVVETASGAAVYASVHMLGKVQPGAQKVGVILCGGNIDFDTLPWFTPLPTY